MAERRSPQHHPPNLISIKCEIEGQERRFVFILDHLAALAFWRDGKILSLRFTHGEYTITFETEATCEETYLLVLRKWEEFLLGLEH